MIVNRPLSRSQFLLSLVLPVALNLLLASCDSTPPDEKPPPESEPPSGVTWTSPEYVPAPDSADQVSHASLATDGDVTYLVFHGLDDRPGEHVPTDVYLTVRDGNGWSAPVNVSQSGTPSSEALVAVGPQGAVHVVWGERIADATPRPGAPPDAIYSAHSTDGGDTWSDPVEVFASRSDAFFSMPRSLVFDAEGHLHLVFSSQESDDMLGQIRHFERTAAGWSGGPTGIAGPNGGGAPDLALGDGGQLLITYLAADTSAGPDRNSVFFTASSDGGQTWDDESVLVDRSGFDQPAQDPTIVASAGRIHVIWPKSLDGDLNTEALYASRSSDGGETWTETVSITESVDTQGGWFHAPTVVADDDGRVHVAVQSGGYEASIFPSWYVQWQGGTWSQVEQLFDADVTSDYVGLAVDEDERVHIAPDGEDIGTEDGIYYSIGEE